MKKLFVLLILMIFSMPVSGETIKAGVSYTEDEARAVAFKGVKTKLPRKMIKANQVDPFYDENKKYREKGNEQIDLGDRYLIFLGEGRYCVSYSKNAHWFYVYNSIGILDYFYWASDRNLVPPYKAVLYNTNGQFFLNLWSPKFRIFYAFDKSGKNILNSYNGKIELTDDFIFFKNRVLNKN